MDVNRKYCTELEKKHLIFAKS